MRIIGSIAHQRMKISVFKNDNRISIKFENPLFEQTFKLQESITGVEEAQRLVDETFMEAVEAHFATLHKIKNDAMLRFLPKEEEDFFDEII